MIKKHSILDRLNFSSDDLQTRSSLLHKIERNLDTSRFRPEDIVVDLTFQGKAIVSVFDVEAMIQLLLMDTSLMNPKNIDHGYDIFSGKSIGPNNCYGKIHMGNAWEPACHHFCGNEPHNTPIALVVFGDKSHLDMHGSLSTLPLIFTLSCFNQEARNKVEFWCPLAFLGALSPKNSKKKVIKVIKMNTTVYGLLLHLLEAFTKKEVFH